MISWPAKSKSGVNGIIHRQLEDAPGKGCSFCLKMRGESARLWRYGIREMEVITWDTDLFCSLSCRNAHYRMLERSRS